MNGFIFTVQLFILLNNLFIYMLKLTAQTIWLGISLWHYTFSLVYYNIIQKTIINDIDG